MYYAAMCTVLAMFMLYRLNEKLKVVFLKILIFKAKINTAHVALSISSKAGSCRNATIFSAARIRLYTAL